MTTKITKLKEFANRPELKAHVREWLWDAIAHIERVEAENRALHKDILKMNELLAVTD